MSDGIPLEITVAEARRLFEGKACTLVDVREPLEVVFGRIDGALLLPSGSLPARLKEIPPGTHILFICRSGGRSKVAAEYARAHGYPDAQSVGGGYLAWKR